MNDGEHRHQALIVLSGWITPSDVNALVHQHGDILRAEIVVKELETSFVESRFPADMTKDTLLTLEAIAVNDPDGGESQTSAGVASRLFCALGMISNVPKWGHAGTKEAQIGWTIVNACEYLGSLSLSMAVAAYIEAVASSAGNRLLYTTIIASLTASALRSTLVGMSSTLPSQSSVLEKFLATRLEGWGRTMEGRYFRRTIDRCDKAIQEVICDGTIRNVLELLEQHGR